MAEIKELNQIANAKYYGSNSHQVILCVVLPLLVASGVRKIAGVIGQYLTLVVTSGALSMFGNQAEAEADSKVEEGKEGPPEAQIGSFLPLLADLLNFVNRYRATHSSRVRPAWNAQ